MPAVRSEIVSEVGGKHGAGTVRVEFSETEDGTLVRLEHSGIPNVKVQGDMEMRVIVREGWTAAFGNLQNLMQAEQNA